VCKAHRRLYHSTLGLRVIEEEEDLRIFDASNGCAPGPRSKRSARSSASTLARYCSPSL